MARTLPVFLLLTCEHGGPRVPARYRRLFPDASEVLRTHRGFDLGALQLAQAMSRKLNAPLIASTTTRLLVDLNRSLGHRRLFSQYSETLDAPSRDHVFQHYYHPYRSQVEESVAEQIGLGRAVLHLSVHSFTPVLDGHERKADLGLLYDRARPREEAFCNRWQVALEACRDDLRLRRNYPYRGTSDGLTTALRQRYPDRRYAGIELEVNQRWPITGGPAWSRLRHDLVATLREVVGG